MVKDNMKIFISHKSDDKDVALKINGILTGLNIESYLDLLDEDNSLKADKLTKHIKKQLNECTDILVVISEKTKNSWWVPFEIGMASQKDLPIVNFLKSGIDLPDYLAYWPRLKSDGDIIKYIEANRTVKKQILNESLSMKHMYTDSTISNTERFYNELKSRL